MKSERRHELQHNLLLDWLIKCGTAIKPYQNVILGAGLALVIVFLIYTIWSKHSASVTSQAWDELDTVLETSGSPSKLAKVAEENSDTPAGEFAAIILADTRLAKGCSDLFENKQTGMQELSRAIEIYEKIRKQSSMPHLQERATFGLARAREARGELEKAEKLYSEVISQWPNGAYTGAATRRLNDLKQTSTKAMYDRFARFDPKPPVSEVENKDSKLDLNNLPFNEPDVSPNDPLLQNRAADEAKSGEEQKAKNDKSETESKSEKAAEKDKK